MSDRIYCFVLCLLSSTDKHGQPGCLGCGCGCSAGNVRLLPGWRAQEHQTKQHGYNHQVTHFLQGTAHCGKFYDFCLFFLFLFLRENVKAVAWSHCWENSLTLHRKWLKHLALWKSSDLHIKTYKTWKQLCCN